MTLEEAIRGGALGETITMIGNGLDVEEIQARLLLDYAVTIDETDRIIELAAQAMQAGTETGPGEGGGLDIPSDAPHIPGVPTGEAEIGVYFEFDNPDTGTHQKAFINIAVDPEGMSWEDFESLVADTVEEDYDYPVSGGGHGFMITGIGFTVVGG